VKYGVTAAYTYGYTGPEMGLVDYLDSLRSLGRMGIKYFDLEILQEKHIPIYLEKKNIELLKKTAQENNVTIAGFTAWVCLQFLHSTDPADNKKAFELFTLVSEIASSFNASYIHLGSDMLREYIVSRDETYLTAPALDFKIPRNVKIADIISRYAENLNKLAEIAAGKGLKFSIEPRANALINGADSFLEIYRKVSHKNLYCCLDVMHCAFHRENIPLAIEKLGDRLLVFQLCDSISGDMTHYPLGGGTTKIMPIIEALKKIQFNGYLMLEIYKGGKDSKSVVDSWYNDAYRLLCGKDTETVLNS